MKKLVALALLAVVSLSVASAQARHRGCCPDSYYGGYYYYAPVVECCPEVVEVGCPTC